MEDGYALSAMADLRLWLGDETNHNRSISMEVMLLSTKNTLNQMDIIDQGITIGSDLPCFAMSEIFEWRVLGTIAGLQDILDKASSLIPAQTSAFQIDPHNMLATILTGGQDLGQMSAAWTALKL